MTVKEFLQKLEGLIDDGCRYIAPNGVIRFRFNDLYTTDAFDYCPLTKVHYAVSGGPRYYLDDWKWAAGELGISRRDAEHIVNAADGKKLWNPRIFLLRRKIKKALSL